MSLQVVGRRDRALGDLASRYRYDGLDDRRGELGLHGEDIVEFAVEAPGPGLATRRAVDEPRGELQSPPVAADAAFEHGGHTESLGDRLCIQPLALEAE